MTGFFSRLAASHNALKEKIHATRIPLGSKGRFAMGVVYFVTPVIFGYNIMQYTNRIAERNLGVYRDGTHKANPEACYSDSSTDHLQKLFCCC
jgi:hypothetical protein